MIGCSLYLCVEMASPEGFLTNRFHFFRVRVPAAKPLAEWEYAVAGGLALKAGVQRLVVLVIVAAGSGQRVASPRPGQC